MSTIMSAPNLVLCLAGEHECLPAIMVEIIKENEDLLKLVREYGAGRASYEQVLELSKEFI
jgi:hypothetical protein